MENAQALACIRRLWCSSGAGGEDISVSLNTHFITAGKAVLKMKYFYFASFYFSNSASSQWAVCWTLLFCKRKCCFHLNLVSTCNYWVRLHCQLKNTPTLNHLKGWIDSGESSQYTEKKKVNIKVSEYRCSQHCKVFYSKQILPWLLCEGEFVKMKGRYLSMENLLCFFTFIATWKSQRIIQF